MGAGGTGGPTRAQILAEVRRQIRELEGRKEATQASITTLENAIIRDEYGPAMDRVESMLEAIIVVQLTTLRAHMVEGNAKLEEMKAGLAKAESPIQAPGGPLPNTALPPRHPRGRF